MSNVGYRGLEFDIVRRCALYCGHQLVTRKVYSTKNQKLRKRRNWRKWLAGIVCRLSSHKAWTRGRFDIPPKDDISGLYAGCTSLRY